MFGHADNKRIESLESKRRRRLGFSQTRFELMPARFDGVKIRAIRRKELEMTIGLFNELLGAFGLVKASIVQNNGLPRIQAGHKKMFDPRVKNNGIGRTLQMHGSLKLLLVVSGDDADALGMG